MGTLLPLHERGAEPPPAKFLAHVYCGQTAVWMKLVLGTEIGLSPGDFVLDGNPVPLPNKGAEPLCPNFQPMFTVAKWLDGSRCHLARR